MKNKYTFEEVHAEALSRAKELIPQWLPGGAFKGDEYCCSDIRGGGGTSLKFNIKKGYGEDFGIGEKYGDMIALYARINGLSNAQAKKAIEIELGLQVQEVEIGSPPASEKPPVASHYKFGEPKEMYPYHDLAGNLLFYVCRYESPTEKTFLPYCWDKVNRHWVSKGYPFTRPLYRVSQLRSDPGRPVMVVEGEKTCRAAAQIVGSRYHVVTWSGGASAFAKTDWSPLFGRNVLIWPDGDEAGMKAAIGIKDILTPKITGAETVRIIRTMPTKDDRDPILKGWDAADVAWDWSQFYKFAKDRIDAYGFKDSRPEKPKVKENRPLPVKQNEIEVKPVEVQTTDLQKYNQDFHITGIQNNLVVSDAITGANISSIASIFRQDQRYKNLFWFDEFYQKRFIERNGHGPVEWDETDDTWLTCEIQTKHGLTRASVDCVRQAAHLFAIENVRNEPRDWMTSLQWDHKTRIDRFLIDYMGVTENQYTMAVSRNFWISLVARVLRPGCKCDTMMILEGKQGTKKSSAINVIGGKYYAQSHDSVTTKDFYQNLQGKFIIEIGELDAFQKAEVNAIKRCLSTPVDRMRTSYSRYAKDYPRQSIFVGTTNDTNYLSDSTGNRRFWPIATKTIDIDKIAADREQLFAEAVTRFKLGQTWYEVPQDLAEKEQMEREIDDAWTEDIKSYCLGKSEISMRDIIVTGLQMEIGKASKRDTNRIGRIIRSLGYINRATREFGVVTKRWVKEETE